MFTGLVESMGEIVSVENFSDGVRIGVKMPDLAAEIALGDSICTNGVCLTAVSTDKEVVCFDLSPQTLEVSNFSRLKKRDKVNLERSLRVGDRLGGHFLTGHVDTCGELLEVKDLGEFQNYLFSLPSSLAPLMVEKGSVGVDGVSLTVAQLNDHSFEVALIPETLDATTLGDMQVGDKVHLEADVLAKHVQRLLSYNT
ncbi:MAG: riboflavin synthase [Planctomycetota bacterium]|nr:riboflavin synthase [Planctomycetota bacterium]